MAENKKSFVGYVDWGDTFNMLDDKDAGKLVKHLFSYLKDENPYMEDKMLSVVFQQIKLQLKRDLDKWNDAKVKRSEGGKKGMDNRWNKLDNNVITHDNLVIKDITPITVNVNGNVNVNEREDMFALQKKEPVETFTIEHCLTIALNDQRWVNANKATRESLLLFNKILEERAEYHKTPIDYKSHFSNLKKRGGLTPLTQINEYKQQSTAPPLKRVS